MRPGAVWIAIILFFLGCGRLFRQELHGINDERLKLLKEIQGLHSDAESYRTVLMRKEQEDERRHLEMIANLRMLATPEQQITLEILRRLKALEDNHDGSR